MPMLRRMVEHLGAVHRGDALVARQHEVAGLHPDLGYDLEGGIGQPATSPSRRSPA